MHTPLHVLLRTDHSEFEIDSRQNLTDATDFVEPIATDLLDLVRNLSEVNGVLVLVSDDNAIVRVDLCELAHTATDEVCKVI